MSNLLIQEAEQVLQRAVVHESALRSFPYHILQQLCKDNHVNVQATGRRKLGVPIKYDFIVALVAYKNVKGEHEESPPKRKRKRGNTSNSRKQLAEGEHEELPKQKKKRVHEHPSHTNFQYQHLPYELIDRDTLEAVTQNIKSPQLTYMESDTVMDVVRNVINSTKPRHTTPIDPKRYHPYYQYNSGKLTVDKLDDLMDPEGFL
ncbi:hypothetical protein BDQ17DRAFT_1330406 [Cyathus striatus]|nr:hypothetical protein BDQ17DRAFT_1330406 [Cyathus striatus]